MTVLEDARELQPDLVHLRRAIHADPEIGLELPRTQQRVMDALSDLPIELAAGPDGSGIGSVVGVLRGRRSTGRSVLVRADMDALPVQEATGLPFAAADGAMHACGHDLHTAMLVGAAQLLSRRRDELAGDVIFMFQPGEEGYDGARHMINAGVLEAAGTPLKAAFALHVTSSLFAHRVVATRPGPFMAAADVLHVAVIGTGGHASTPHAAQDPVPVAAEMITALQTLVTRQFSVFDPVVITVGRFQAGTQHNIIPERAEFEATVRSFSSEAQSELSERAVRLCRGLAHAHGLEADVRWQTLYPVTTNDRDESDFLVQTAQELLGREATVAMLNPLSGSEDFSRVLQRVPGSMAFLGAIPRGADPSTAPFNHSAYAVFDESVLSDGAALYAQWALARLAASATD